MPDAQIQLRALQKQFGSATAVEALSLDIPKGEFLVLLGPSGCGKTTTLRMIAGLESPSSGAIAIAGKDVTTLRPGLRDIAFVFQMFSLYPHLSVHDNIAFPLRAAGLSAADIGARVQTIAQRLAIAHLLPRKPAKLSGGDQQRVSLARALVRSPAPSAFLMDEPLGALDAQERESTRAQLRALHNELHATTVFVTHDQLEAMSLADRIAIMHNGRLLQCAPPRDVYDHPADLFVANFIGSPGMNFLPPGSPHGHAHLARATVGIRPEYISLVPTSHPAALPAFAELTQHLGPHNLLALRLGSPGGPLLKARIPAALSPAENAPIHIHLHPEGLRAFDPATGKALTI